MSETTNTPETPLEDKSARRAWQPPAIEEIDYAQTESPTAPAGGGPGGAYSQQDM